jgi:hypothetical protein
VSRENQLEELRQIFVNEAEEHLGVLEEAFRGLIVQFVREFEDVIPRRGAHGTPHGAETLTRCDRFRSLRYLRRTPNLNSFRKGPTPF